MATYVAASRAAAAWARRKQVEFDARADEFHARNADLDDTPSLLPLYVILFCILLIGLVVTAFALHSHVDLHPIIAH